MDKYREEVRIIGGEALLKVVDKEFDTSFHIVARDQDMIVLGNKEKNVKFSRDFYRVMERFFLDKTRSLSRKTPY